MRWLYNQRGKMPDGGYQIHENGPCLTVVRGEGKVQIHREHLPQVISCLLVYLTTEAPG